MSFKSNILVPFVFIILLIAPTRVHAQDSIKESEQFDFAQGLLSREMYDMAILQLQKFISDYPQSSSLPDAYLSLGEGYFLSQDFNKAVDAFSQFNKLYPKSDKLPLSLLRLGQIAIDQKNYDDALKGLTSIDVQKQLNGEMLQSFDYYIAQAYLGKEDTVSAMDYFQKAAQVQGASTYTAFAYKEIGKIQSQNAHYPEAMDAYNKAMAQPGDYSLKGELAYRIAEVNFLSGQYADAIKGFQKVLEQYSNLGFDQDALANLLLADFNLGQYGQLISEYQKDSKEIKDDDTYFSIHYAAVMAYIELKEYDQANALLDHLLTFSDLKSQDRAKIYIKKADILIRQKEYKDGLAVIDSYFSKNTDAIDEISFLRAEAYYGLGDFDKAFGFFDDVVAHFPGSHFSQAALLGEAHCRQETGGYKDSEALFLKYYGAQADTGLKSESLYDAVMMAQKAGDADGVISSAQEYLKTYPNGENYGDVLLTLADSEGKNNRPQDAVKLLQGYLAGTQSPQRPNAANFLLGFYQQQLGSSDLALAAYAKVDINKENGNFYVAALKNMAIIYLTQKKLTQARTYFDQLISQTGDNGLQLETYVWVCNEYLKEQKYEDVLRVAAQAEKRFLAKDLVEIEYFKAESLRALGRCDEAEKNYDTVIASPEKNAYTGSSHIGRGLCLETSQKYDDAKKDFQASLDENADDYTVTVHARFEMAQVDVSQGNLDDALKLYLLIATIYDDDYYCSESLLKAGQIAEKLKRRDDALKMYSEILDKYKNSKAALEAKKRMELLK